MSFGETTARRSRDSISSVGQRKSATADIDMDRHQVGYNHSNGTLGEHAYNRKHEGNVTRNSKKTSNNQKGSLGSQVLRLACFTSFFLLSCLLYVKYDAVPIT